MGEIKSPRVSIGMPVYNGERCIRQTLDTLVAQTFTDFELIISDNASTDNSRNICMEYAARDKRIRYYRNERNMGAIYNSNRVFALSNGEYFMLSSCHDLRERNFLSRCIEIMQERKTIVLCYPLADCINEEGNFLEVMPPGIDTRGLDSMSRCHLALWGIQYAYSIYGLIRADALKQTRIFKKTIGTDIILLFELSFLGEFGQIPEILLHIRRMPNFGSWDGYIETTFGKPIRGLRRRWLFWGMLFEYLRAVNRYTRSIPAKVFLMFSTLLCILVKYRWIRHGLVEKKLKS